MSPEDRKLMLIAEIEALTAALQEKGLWIKGSMGQDILNPALAARRAAIETLRRLDKDTRKGDDEADLDAYLAMEDDLYGEP